MLAATREYEADQDTLAEFLRECCVTEPSAKAPMSVLFEAFKKWSGDAVITRSNFRKRLEDKGFQTGPGLHNRTCWLGIALGRPDEPESREDPCF